MVYGVCCAVCVATPYNSFIFFPPSPPFKKNLFEDRASLAVLQRKLDLPHFTSAENNGVLTIVTDEVILKYTVGKGFSADTLTVQPATKDSTFPGHVLSLTSHSLVLRSPLLIKDEAELHSFSLARALSLV